MNKQPADRRTRADVDSDYIITIVSPGTRWDIPIPVIKVTITMPVYLTVCQPVGMLPGYNKCSIHSLNIAGRSGTATITMATIFDILRQ